MVKGLGDTGNRYPLCLLFATDIHFLQLGSDFPVMVDLIENFYQYFSGTGTDGAGNDCKIYAAQRIQFVHPGRKKNLQCGEFRRSDIRIPQIKFS